MKGQRLGTILKWTAMPLITVALFILIDAGGRSLNAPVAPTAVDSAATTGSVQSDSSMHLLLALTAVIICGYLIGQVLRRIGQAPVIGEVLAGIVLGPSLLGRIAPAAQHFLLPPSVAPALGVIALFGAILYMFLLGLEVDLREMKKNARATFLIAQSSIVTPFLLGAAMALFLYQRLSDPSVSFTNFSLFLGVAMSITAFPVLARILTDRGMHKTQLGTLALSCAALNDMIAWCLLAIAVGAANATVDNSLFVIVGAIVFVGIMLTLVRPITKWLVTFGENVESTRGIVAAVFVGMLLSALAAEWIGIHAIFGAFLLGTIIPHDSLIARTFIAKLEDLVTIVLLPAFFALTGLRTQIGVVDTGADWLLCGVIILVATIGKFGGAMVAARLCGRSWHDAAALGILMNTRGLMELIVLNIGLDLKIISPKLFAMMVMMALVTTLATTPLLQVLARREEWRNRDRHEWRVRQPIASSEFREKGD